MFSKKELTFEMVTTKGGDDGKSSLYNGERLLKDDPVFNFLGEIDSISSEMGLAKAYAKQFTSNKETKLITDFVTEIQSKFIQIGALAAKADNASLLDENDIYFIESFEKKILKKVTIEPVFTLPGRSITSAAFHVVRTSVRKAEREIVHMIQIQQFRLSDFKYVQKFLNRLSDALYIVASFYEQNEKAI